MSQPAPIGIGSTNISAQDPVSQIASDPLKVSCIVKGPVSVTVSPTTTNLSIGGSRQLRAQLNYSDGTTLDVTNESSWTSSNTGIATVSDVIPTKGSVIAIAVGPPSVVISAAHAASGFSGDASVTVINNPCGMAIFCDNFESYATTSPGVPAANIGRWSVENGTWQVGVPTSGPSQAFSGNNVAATNLAGDYPNNNYRLISPSIVLPAIGPTDEILLRFQHWFSFGSGDNGQVQIRIETAPGVWGAWSKSLQTSTLTSNGWSSSPIVYLTIYAGSKVQYSFLGANGSGNVGRGWFIDDISVNIIIIP